MASLYCQQSGQKRPRCSTGTIDLEEAKVIALQLATDLWKKEAAGQPTTSRRFNWVAGQLISQMEADLKNWVGKKNNKESIRILRLMIAFFGTQLIGSLGIDDLRLVIDVLN